MRGGVSVGAVDPRQAEAHRAQDGDADQGARADAGGAAGTGTARAAGTGGGCEVGMGGKLRGIGAYGRSLKDSGPRVVKILR